MRDSAVTGGGQEATQELARALSANQNTFQQALSRANLGASDRTRTLSEMSQLFGGGPQGMSNPLTTNAAGPNGVDIMGAANSSYQNRLGAANASNAQDSQFWSGLGSLALAAAMYASDRRLKRDIVPVGDGLYTFRYLGSSERVLGRMAQEAPAGVAVSIGGYLQVPWKWVLYGHV
jgi:hypothetical protein